MAEASITPSIMHLVSDYIHPTTRGGKCRVRAYRVNQRQSETRRW